MYESFSIIFALSALFSVINYKWLKLPATIGQLILALALAVLVICLEPIAPSLYGYFCGLVLDADFTHILLDILLGFLLFAGALHVDLKDLKAERKYVIVFATIGVLISTFLIGGAVYLIAGLMGIGLPFIHSLLFGALISPTDPIAVLALLKDTSVSKSLQLKIEGESLFNDGIGVIVFTAILSIAGMSEMASEHGSLGVELFTLFFEEVIIGLLLGVVLGYVGFRIMKSAEDNPNLNTIISLAVVFGGYALATMLHSSGPLAMVVAGLYMGNKIKSEEFSKASRDELMGFWHILDESLNGVLFVFLGLALHLIVVDHLTYIWLALLSIPVILTARFIAVGLPYSLLRHEKGSWFQTTSVLTWGGLRGGISLALAFSLLPDYSRDLILILTYAIVIFSILVQGMTISRLIDKLYP